MEWDIGEISRTAARAISLCFALYTVGVGYNAWRAFQNGLEDRWSAAIATAVMVGLVRVLWTDGAQILPAPFSIIVLLALAAGVTITLTFTIGRYQDKIEHFRVEFGGRMTALLEDILPEDRLAEWRRIQDKLKPDQETFRKAPHLGMGLFLIFYGIVGYAVLRGIWVSAYGGSPGTGEGANNLFAASHAVEGTYLVAGHMFSLMLLLSLFALLLPNELLRLRYPELSYPFKQTILRAQRKKEEGLFGAHLYIAATLPLAIILVTWDAASWPATIPAVLAILAVTIFADSASALFGKRWGKTKWFHSPDKTYVGTLAGALTAVAVALPFVGVEMAIISAAVFVAVDLLAPIPFPASDNLLNPMALAIVYIGWTDLIAPLIPFY